MDDLKEFGKQIKSLREDLKMTMTDLSKISGVSQPYISQIESGKRKPSVDVVIKLAKALNVSEGKLLLAAGYNNLGARLVMQEIEKDFSDIDDHLLWEIRQQEMLLSGIIDIREFLQRDVPPYPLYNGHRLTDKDKKMAITVLDAIFLLQQRAGRVNRYNNETKKGSEE